MTQPSNRSAEFLMFCLGIALVGYVITKAFSDHIGMDLEAGGRLLLGIALGVILLAYAAWNELTDGFLGFPIILPLALSTAWSGLWPAMQVWGVKPLYLASMPIAQEDLAWWATQYTQWGGFAALLIGGYGIAYVRWRYRYR